MKRWVAVLAIVALVLGGCAASQEEVMSYHQTTQWTNEAILESVKEQAKDNSVARTQSMVHFSAAMTEASKTEDPTDNAVIAFAWGFATATPHNIEIPKLQYPARPDSSVDALRAWTPIIGMAIPLLTPLLYGWANYGEGDSMSIAADNGATVVLESGNSGAFKSKVGGDNIMSEVDQSEWTLIDQSVGGAALEVEGEGGLGVEQLPAEAYAECITNPPGGYKEGTGTPLAANGNSCKTEYL